MSHRPSAAAVLLVAVAATAHADIVDMHFSTLGRGQPVELSLGSQSVRAFAGQLVHETTAADSEELLGAFLGSQPYFCIDPFQATSRQSLPYTLTDLTGVPDSLPMRDSTAAAVRSLFASANHAQFAGDAPDDLAAAFQLALWEVVSDFDAGLGRSSLDLDRGWFRASAPGRQPLSESMLARMDTFFNAVESGERYSGQVIALRSPVAQDQLTAVAGVPASIPTSGSLASFSLGLGLMFGRRRR